MGVTLADGQPPLPPEPIVNDVATIFTPITPATTSSVNFPSIASCTQP